MAVVYLGGYRLLPGVALGAFLLAITRVPIHWAVLMGLAALIQPTIDVRILRWLKFDEKLERVRDPVMLSLVAGPAGALGAALVSVTLQTAQRADPPQMISATSWCCGGCATGSA